MARSKKITKNVKGKSQTNVKSTVGKKKKKPVQRTTKAGISVPISRIGGVARRLWPTQVGQDAEVILAAAADAIMTKLLVDAAKKAGQKKTGEKHTILPNDIEWAIANNRWAKGFVKGHVGSVYIQ